MDSTNYFSESSEVVQSLWNQLTPVKNFTSKVKLDKYQNIIFWPHKKSKLKGASLLAWEVNAIDPKKGATDDNLEILSWAAIKAIKEGEKRENLLRIGLSMAQLNTSMSDEGFRESLGRDFWNQMLSFDSLHSFWKINHSKWYDEQQMRQEILPIFHLLSKQTQDSILYYSQGKGPSYFIKCVRNREKEINNSPQRTRMYTPPASPLSPHKYPTNSPKASPDVPRRNLKDNNNNITTFGNLLKQSQVKIKKLIILEDDRFEVVDEVAVSNRTFRVVGDHTRFVMVSLDPKNKRNYSEILKNLKQITIDGQTYKFLIFTASGLRYSKLWYFKEDEKWTVESLRNRLGEFSPVLKQGAGKLASRLGQAFSDSIPTVKISKSEIFEMGDEFSKDGICFTDGVGMISRTVAEEVQKMLGLEYLPSAFQIRIAGIKGVVSVWDFGDSNYKLRIRPSMKKFEADFEDLEILSWSKPTFGASLNKQIINLLTTLGVSDEEFIKRMEKNIEKWNRLNEDINVAISVLKSIDNIVARKVFQMLLAEHSINEPEVQNLLDSLKVKHLESLNKLHIPVKKSRYLMGIIDETGILEENQVYINLTGHGELNSTIFVTRIPCLHPGDLRVLQTAGSVKELNHLVDVIVFPKKGEHPLTDMMSGGDLDGDMYFVCWEAALIPQKTEEFANYHITENYEPTEVDPNNIDETLLNFFAEYHEKNQLERIIAAHEITCYNSDMRALEPEAIKLALKAARALDAAKTGNFVSLDKEFPTRDPHVENVFTKLLALTGQLKIEKTETELADVTPDPDLKYVVDQDQWEQLKQEAKVIHKDFNRDLAVAIDKDQKEKESREARFSKMRMVKLEPETRTQQVEDKYLSIFYDNLDRRDERQIKQKASAWYYAAYESDDNTEKFRPAFAWLVYFHLNEIKAAAVASRQTFPCAISVTPRMFSMLLKKKVHGHTVSLEYNERDVNPAPTVEEVKQEVKEALNEEVKKAAVEEVKQENMKEEEEEEEEDDEAELDKEPVQDVPNDNNNAVKVKKEALLA